MPAPWERVHSESLVDTRWFRLRADTWRMPAGGEVTPYFVVEAPAWLNVVALTEADEVILVRQFRPGFNAVTLEFPAGSLDAVDASPMAGAQRELLEETGYGGGTWEELAVLSPNPAMFANRMYCFLARGVHPLQAAAPDLHEDIEVVCLPFAELVRRVDHGEVLHALQVAALYHARRALGR